jgi:hypothetical protein
MGGLGLGLGLVDAYGDLAADALQQRVGQDGGGGAGGDLEERGDGGDLGEAPGATVGVVEAEALGGTSIALGSDVLVLQWRYVVCGVREGFDASFSAKLERTVK